MSRKFRRSLSNQGGPSAVRGDAEWGQRLAHAFDTPPLAEAGTDGPDRAHVHGFHPYPARLHPVTAARLVESLAPPGARVLDPFSGSGTVLVEAMVARRLAFGVDINPLAIELARLKTTPRTQEWLTELVAAATNVARVADNRRIHRVGATHRFGVEDTELFAPHVLLELDSIRFAIDAQTEPRFQRALMLVMSSILVKLSRLEGDSSARLVDKRLASGFAIRTFLSKATELAQRLSEFSRKLSPIARRADVVLGDARRLTELQPPPFDAVVTSPPYAATYDYVSHHALRLRWLGMPAEPFSDRELGSRRQFSALSPADARSTWASELRSLFVSLGDVLAPRGLAALVMADSAVADEPLPALDAVRASSRGLFSFVASASQHRPHFDRRTERAFARAPRCEHIVLLERCDMAAPEHAV